MPAVSSRLLHDYEPQVWSEDNQDRSQVLIDDVRYANLVKADSSVVSCQSSATTKVEMCFASCL